MTALTPLEFIHKKGLFGDHHKQYEKDMLKISELNNLTIVHLLKLWSVEDGEAFFVEMES